MTELQIGLIGLGATAVVGVVAYNTWQEYRHRKLADKILKAQHPDVLLDERAIEDSPAVDSVPELFDTPSLSTGEAGFATSSAHPNERIEPVMYIEPEVQPIKAIRFETPADTVNLAPSEPIPSRVAEDARDLKEAPDSAHLLSPLVDYVASFEAVEPAPAYQILESQRDVLARIRKPIHWIGFNEFSREWEPIVDNGESEYRRIKVGLQLVDRQGVLSESDLSIFSVAMQDLSDELMAITNLPSRQPVLESAATLDAFCASVDIQIGINVISQGQVFPGTKLRALAEAAGMGIDSDGRFVRCDDEGNVLYVLLNQEVPGFSSESMKTMTTNGITFLLDVPRVAHGERVFNQMVDLARRFADVLRGSLVDDNRRPLSESALEPIRRQVGQYQSLMAAQHLPAGSPLTQRLFS